MAELRDRMARDLALRNFAAGTREAYLRCCCGFVRYHMKSPLKLGEADIKEYLHRLLLTGGSAEKLKMHVAGLKFLYGVTLNRPQVVARIPWPKVVRVPRHADHRFHGMLITDSTASRSPVPREADHP